MLWCALALGGPVDDLLADVVDNDPVLDVLGARMDADALVRPVPQEARFRPVIRDLGTRTRQPSVSLRFRQPFDPPGSLRAERRELEAERALDGVEARLRAADLRAEALSLYDAGRLARVEATLLDEELGLVDRRLEVLHLRLSGGLAVADEVAEAVVDRLGILQRRSWAEVAAASAERQLSRAAGRPVSLDPATLEAELMAPLVDPTAVDASAALHAAEASLTARRAERRPFVDWLQAEIEPRPAERTSYGVAANIAIPLWRFRDGEVAAARERVAIERRAADRERAQSDGRRAEARADWTRHREAVEAGRQALQEASIAVEALSDELIPDERLEAAAALVRERRRWWQGVERALEARRTAERTR